VLSFIYRAESVLVPVDDDINPAYIEGTRPEFTVFLQLTIFCVQNRHQRLISSLDSCNKRHLARAPTVMQIGEK